MANEKNLKRLSPKQAREYGRKGGIASVAAKRKQKTLKELLKLELNEPVKFEENGKTYDITKAVKIVKALIERAFTGDVNAFNSIRDLIGEKPAEKISADIKTDVSAEFVNVFLNKFKKGKK